MTKITDLPKDMLEEVVSRVPVTSSLRGFRSACKTFNILCKDRRFITKHQAREKPATKNEFLTIMMMDYQLHLMSVNLNGINLHNEGDDNAETFMVRKGTLNASLNDEEEVGISSVIHCDGLVLCVAENIGSRLVVWNPYLGQTRWIKPRSRYTNWDKYAFGYEVKNKSGRRCYKILGFRDDIEFEIYSFRSNSWRVVNVFDTDWEIECEQSGVMLKGNTYWHARERFPDEDEEVEDGVDDLIDFLICFDFTKKRFRKMKLPFHACFREDTVTLSTVGDEKLTALFQKDDATLRMEIWVTSKIDTEKVSWSKLFAVDGLDFMFGDRVKSFFVEEESKVAVVFDKGNDELESIRNIGYVIGEDGYYREVYLGESMVQNQCPHGCFYVPSSLTIKQGGQRKRKMRCLTI